MIPHQCIFRIYYEDTDAGGVVYYANYLKFAERARTELLRAEGIGQTQLVHETGILFVVLDATIHYKSSAKLDDMIRVETMIEDLSSARAIFNQCLFVDDRLVAKARVGVTAIHQSTGQVTRIPESVKDKLKEYKA